LEEPNDFQTGLLQALHDLSILRELFQPTLMLRHARPRGGKAA
jgi:hypothetical protein